MRLGIYQLSSQHAADKGILKHAINKDNFLDTAVVIMLDWTQPWNFIRSLLRWIHVLREAVYEIEKEKGGKHVVQLGKDELELFLQRYSEPTEMTIEESVMDIEQQESRLSKEELNVLLPLEKGVLDSNMGIPIVIVCAKSDAMVKLETERGLKEEDFDYIQQTLRTICLNYGASLFYTSLAKPMSYAELRHYIVHRLLNRKDVAHHLENSREEKSMSDNMVVDLSHEASVLPFKNVGSDLSKSANSYPFRLRAQVIDRDVVRVPSGWDSKAKIQFLREGFKQEECINTWKSDLGRFELYVQKLEEMLSDPSANPKFNLAKLIAKSQKDADEICMHDQSGLLHLYSQVIHPPSYNIPGPNNTTISTHISPELVDYGATAASLYSNLATFEGNQNFLQKLYQDQQSRSESSEDLYSVADSRPRSHKHSISSTTLANKNPSLLPTWNATQSRYNNSESLLSTAIPPLANQPTSISPPPVTNATTSDKTSSVLSSASKKASSSSPKPQSSGFTPTPISTSTSTSTTSGKPSEVLSSFFQNLLDKKTTSQQK